MPVPPILRNPDPPSMHAQLLKIIVFTPPGIFAVQVIVDSTNILLIDKLPFSVNVILAWIPVNWLGPVPLAAVKIFNL
jgi:hypothetical protein